MLHVHVLKSLSKSRGQFTFLRESRAFSSRPSGGNEAADLDAAREWFRRFNKATIPEKIAKTEFSRSSGAGGQKVNKTSSKATTVWELHMLYPHVPKVLHQGLRNSRHYVSSSDSIKMQCDTSRSQSENREENYRKLFDEITRIYKQRVPGITPPEQLKKIEQLNILSPRARQSECRRKKLDAAAFKKLKRQVLVDAKEKRKLKMSSAGKLEAKLERARQKHNSASVEDAKNRKSSKARKKKAENAARLRMKKLHGDKKRARSGGGGGGGG